MNKICYFTSCHSVNKAGRDQIVAAMHNNKAVEYYVFFDEGHGVGQRLLSISCGKVRAHS